MSGCQRDVRARLGRTLACAFLGLVFAALPARGALAVTIAVSPTQAIVGQSVEVLVRTFVPIPGNAVDLPTPSASYPASSGLWDVLYPTLDYPFKATARADDGTEFPVSLERDTTDATLWRGAFTPTRTGVWTISLVNFAQSVTLEVAPAESLPFGIPLAAMLLSASLSAVGLGLGYLIGRTRIGLGRP